MPADHNERIWIHSPRAYGDAMLLQIIARLLFPQSAPKGVTTLLISILFFGSLNLFAVSLIGEYLAKIFEEVKRRPHFIRRSIIAQGEVRFASMEQPPTVEL